MDSVQWVEARRRLLSTDGCCRHSDGVSDGAEATAAGRRGAETSGAPGSRAAAIQHRERATAVGDGQLMSLGPPDPWLATNAVQLIVPIGDDGQLMSLGPPVLWLGTNAA